MKLVRRLDSNGFTRGNIIGFCIPFAIMAIIGIGLHIHTSLTNHHQQQQQAASTTKSANTSATTTVGTPPSAPEVSAANAAILAYCTSDLRQDSSCKLIDNSNVTAPGFVASQISESGSFADGVTNAQGTALAKGSGSSWTVIWVGQGCVPKNVATQYAVPNAFTICAS